MINEYEKVISLIFKAINDINQQLLPEQRVDPSPETVLIGEQSNLDSMALVSLLVVIEGEVGQDFGIDFTLVDENRPLDENILKNVSTLAEYITDIINKQKVL
jgi:acyl carrier protein